MRNSPFAPRTDHRARKAGVRIVPEKFLIVCEDTDSGLRYLEDLIDHMQLSSVTIVEAGRSGTDPKNLVAYTRKKLMADNYSRACAVFDGDVCRDGGPEKSRFDGAIESAKAKPPIATYVSIPCMEFWFLLHCEFTARPFENCASVEQALGKKIPDGKGYEKKEQKIFKRLTSQNTQCQIQAVQRAEQLRLIHERGYANPSTEMDLLLTRLKEMAPGHPRD